MSALVGLPPVSSETTEFIATTDSTLLQDHLNYSKFDFDFAKWKENIESKYRKQQKLFDKQLVKDGDDSDEDDDDEGVDEEVYAIIPDKYDFKIQTPFKDLDPRTWRDHDHYKVLGLDEFRWATRPEDIKRAYRQLVLKYHPDKGREKLTDKTISLADLFSCLTKSFEFLQQPKLRRSYDSYDPEFDDDIPSAHKKITKDTSTAKFFETFAPVFETNARWSRHLLPPVGDDNSTMEQVDAFYNAWYEFESWREFTYEKLEDIERADDAYERRWIQTQLNKENKGKRRDEVKRIRSLVDNAYASDPRVKRFQAEERARKEAEKIKKKQEREAQKAAKAAEEQARLDAERKIQEEKDAEIQKQRDEEKKKREAAKKLVKKSRQALRKCVLEQIGQAEASKLDTELNLICSQLDAVQLDEYRGAVAKTAKNLVRKCVLGKFEEVKKELRKDETAVMEEKAKKLEDLKKEKEWSTDDIQLLVKAANLFPAGATQRWNKISTYFNDHHDENAIDRNPKECTAAVKKLTEAAQSAKGGKGSSGDASDAFSQFLSQRKHQNMSKPKDGEISETFEEQDRKAKAAKEAKPVQAAADAAWTSAEQKLLEQALRTYPANFGKERWDKIAEAVPTRSKRDCMLRYKEIATQLMAKKKAAAKVAAKK